MTILEDQTDYTIDVEPLAITRAEYRGAYKLHLWFIDGKDHDVDFAPFLLNARHPVTAQYRDQKLFQAFTIEHGNLHWNNYDLCFETALLYQTTVVEYNGFG